LRRVCLTAQPETLDNVLILLRLTGLEVIEELAALVDHLHESATGRVVRRVRGKVLPETGNTLGEQRDLNFRRTRVLGIPAELGNDCSFSLY